MDILQHANDNRTPTEHRAAIEAWAACAPANDSEIWGRRAKSESPRLAHLRDDYSALQVWRALREVSEAGPSGTTWMSAHDTPEPTNDNEPAAQTIEWEFRTESLDALRAWLERMLRGVIVEERRDGRRLIVGGDVTFSPKTGRLVKAGKLRFADLTNKRQAHDPRAGEVLNGRSPGKVERIDGEVRFRGRTGSPPPESPPPTGQEAFEARDELEALLPLLSPRTVTVLDAAIRVPNLEAVGEALGHTGDYARKAGLAALRRACAEFETAAQELEMKAAA